MFSAGGLYRWQSVAAFLFELIISARVHKFRHNGEESKEASVARPTLNLETGALHIWRFVGYHSGTVFRDVMPGNRVEFWRRFGGECWLLVSLFHPPDGGNEFL
jgi:hypothetical protein